MLNKRTLEIVQKKAAVISKADASLISSLSPIEKQIFDQIKSIISKLNTSGGSVLFDDQNIDIVSSLEKEIIEGLQAGRYPEEIKAYLDKYDEIQSFQEQIHEEANGVPKAEFKELVTPIRSQMIKDVTDNLTRNGIKSQFIKPLREALFKNVVAGANIQDIEKELKAFIEGDEARHGRLRRYVEQVSRDALYQFNGSVNSAIAEKYNLDAFQYVGTLVEDTRKQCTRWVRKSVILRRELEKEIAWAYRNGSGMIPGTNAANFSINRGGYNCRHEAIPFKLTASELEELNKGKK